MTWFISAFVIASAIFVFAPKSLATPTADSLTQIKGQWRCLLLPLLLLMSLAFILATLDNAPYLTVAMAFTLTGFAVAVPKLHPYIITGAAFTALSLLLLVLQR